MVPLARYDVENKIIYAEEVKNIQVADANIILNDGLLTIRENADMAPIDSASIVLANDTNFTHTIYNSHLKVGGKLIIQVTENTIIITEMVRSSRYNSVILN